jgi:predicted aminopeptidase
MNKKNRPLLLCAFPVILALLLSGCYTLKQGITLLGYLNQAIPLEKIDNEDFIRLVKEIRAFAMEELGLKESRNYTSFVKLDRDYLAAVVSASAKDSFRRHEWDYPIVGRLPYKGFFNIKDARKERSELEKKGLDVWIRGVDAFSTLGWFKDPIYSYMMDYSTARLADLIIHELVHATVFIKGQANFNEELAEFIGSEGAGIFIAKRYGEDSDEYRQIFTSNKDSQNYVAFIQELSAELDVLYTSKTSREEKLAGKERIIKAAKERFNAEYDKLFSSDNYKGFADLPVNNAYIELFRLYHTKDNFYTELYERSGKDLPAFINAAKKITKKGNPRLQLENAIFQ